LQRIPVDMGSLELKYKKGKYAQQRDYTNRIDHHGSKSINRGTQVSSDLVVLTLLSYPDIKRLQLREETGYIYAFRRHFHALKELERKI